MPLVSVGVWLLVTRGSYWRVEKVFLVLCSIYVTYIVAGFLAHPDWGKALHSTVVPSVTWNSHLAADRDRRHRHDHHAVGTVLHPGDGGRQEDLGARTTCTPRPRSSSARFVTDMVDFFIVVACAATLYASHTLVNSAQDAAKALRPLAGELAFLLFGLGLLNVSILAAGILPLATAYAVCEAFGFEAGLDSEFKEAPIFNGLLTFFIFVPALVAVIPGLPLIKVMLLSQDVNGILLPIILIYVLKVINDRSVMGEYVNGPIYNAVAWAFSMVLIALSVVLIGTALPLPFLH